MIVAALTILLSVQADASPHQPPEGPPTDVPRQEDPRAEVAGLVRMALDGDRSFESVYRQDVWFASSRERDPERSPPDVSQRHRIIRSPGGWRIEDESGDQSRVWWGDRGWVIDLPRRAAAVAAEPLDPHDFASRILHQSEGFGSPTIHARLREEIAAASEVRVERRGNVLVVRYRLPANDDVIRDLAAARGTDGAELSPWQMQVEVEQGSPPRLIAYQIDFAQPRADGSRGKGARVEVVQWRTLDDGSTIPQVVRRSAWSPKGASEERFVRESHTPLTRESADQRIQFSPPREGWTLTDPRLRLRMEVGSPNIELDGRRLRLKEPLFDLPGDRLPDLLREAAGDATSVQPTR